MTPTFAPILGLALFGQLAAEGPRHRLEVGQVLEYEGYQGSRSNGMAQVTTWEMTAWVLDRAGPDGWRVLVEVRSRRLGHRWSPTPDGSLPEKPPYKKEGTTWDNLLGRIADDGRAGNGARSSDLAVVAVHADGRVVGDEMTLEGVLDGRAGQAFAPPPADLLAAGPEADGSVASSKSRRSKGPGGIEVDRATRKRFDPARGLLVEASGLGTAPGSPAYRSEDRLALNKVGKVEPAWLDRARPESVLFDQAQAKVNAVESLIGGDTPGNARDAIDAMQKAIDAANDAAKLPIFADHLKDLSARAADLVAYQGERDAKVKALVGSAAADWKANDLDGRGWDMASLRGKVVVVDFWYRGCGWCIKAMPQMVDVAGRFQGKPVQFLGMNTDEDPADARQVANAQKLNYPTLLAHGLGAVDDYGAGTLGFPTLVVVDRKGVIREVVVGYSEDLAETLSGVLDRLLNED